MLTRAQIQAIQDFTKQEVFVEEWGGSLYIRSMTVGALDDMHVRFAQLSGTDPGNGASPARQHPEAMRDMMTRLLSYTLCDAQGSLLFDDEEGRDILRQKNPVVIERLFEVASRMNRLGAVDIEAEKKASGLTPTPDSN